MCESIKTSEWVLDAKSLICSSALTRTNESDQSVPKTEVTVCPDLAKFHHFCKKIIALDYFVGVYVMFAKLHWQFSYAIGHILIILNGKILNK